MYKLVKSKASLLHRFMGPAKISQDSLLGVPTNTDTTTPYKLRLHIISSRAHFRFVKRCRRKVEDAARCKNCLHLSL